MTIESVCANRDVMRGDNNIGHLSNLKSKKVYD